MRTAREKSFSVSPPFAVRGQHERHCIPPDIDIGMMIGMFRDECDRLHVCHCFDKILFYDPFSDRCPNPLPPSDLRHVPFDLEFAHHGHFTHPFRYDGKFFVEEYN